MFDEQLIVSHGLVPNKILIVAIDCPKCEKQTEGVWIDSVIKLSDKATKRFLEALENPSEPTECAKEAVKRFKENCSS
jgi:hypothetical protein